MRVTTNRQPPHRTIIIVTSSLKRILMLFIPFRWHIIIIVLLLLDIAWHAFHYHCSHRLVRLHFRALQLFHSSAVPPIAFFSPTGNHLRDRIMLRSRLTLLMVHEQLSQIVLLSSTAITLWVWVTKHLIHTR